MANVKELWLPANELKNIEVSNYGNVRGVTHALKEKYKAVKEDGVYKRVLISAKSYPSYHEVELRVNPQGYLWYKDFAVHVKVAQLFIPNPDNLPQVNHKKGDKLDNRSWMLEWCTSQYNTFHAVYELGHVTTFGIKKVRIYKDGKEIHIAPSVSEAARFLGGQSTQVSRVLLGTRNHYKGHTFQYVA